MSNDKENIEQEKFKNQSWWKKLLGLNPTSKLKKLIIILFIIVLLCILFDIVSKYAYIHNENQYPLLVPRYSHSAIFLDENHILIIGGNKVSSNKTDMVLDNAEIFDLNTNKSNFTDKKMLEARIKPSDILLHNNNVFIIGGNEKNTTSEIYNSEKNIFEKYADLHNKKNSIFLANIDDNNILVIDNYSHKIELYNEEQNEYKEIGEIPRHYKFNNIKNNCAYFNNNIYLAYTPKSLSSIKDNNEYSFLIYNLLMKKFSILKNESEYFNKKVCRENSIINYNNVLIGLCSSKNDLNIVNFDLNSNSFFDEIYSFKPFSIRKYKSLLLKNNKKILIYGGYNSAQPIKYNEYIFVYDIPNNQLKKYKHPFFAELIKNGAVIINDKEDNIYIVGGFLKICFEKIKLLNGVKKIQIEDIENE